jgi:CheY-like chemotaxis protein
VLLDLHLPDMHGEEVLRELRRVPACADVPVVVVTADASPGARERMLGLGSNGFLTKPIDLDDVLGWIDGAQTSGERP